MPGIFPPSGRQDEGRVSSLKEEERNYLWFCLEFCDQILLRRPDHIEALETAANHFTELGYYTDGLALDRRLADIKPRDPGILYNLSCSLALVDNRDEAFEVLEKAVRSGYDDIRHMAEDRDLASIRDDQRFSELLRIAGKGRLDRIA